jgi:hypothetical protein
MSQKLDHGPLSLSQRTVFLGFRIFIEEVDSGLARASTVSLAKALEFALNVESRLIDILFYEICDPNLSQFKNGIKSILMETKELSLMVKAALELCRNQVAEKAARR